MNYSKLLKKGEQYDELTPVISINLLNFNLNKSNKNVHSCYMIYDTKNARLLTDHLQIHMIELKKFKFKDNNLPKDLNCWLGFFTTNNMEDYMSEIVKEKPIMEEAQKRYNNFIRSRLMMSEYERKEIYQYDKKIALADERRIGMRQGIKKGKLEGIREGVEKGKLEGIKEGIEKGKYDEQILIAKTLKQMNMDDASISKATGLSIEEIRKL